VKRITFAAAVIVLGLLTLSPQAGSAGPPKVLEFDMMAAVVGPYVGGAHPIRGVPGGGLPWAIDDGEGELRSDGTLEVEVEGLVLANVDPVPEALRGTNPIPNFRAVVSCETIDATGAAETENVRTEPFPATTDGDSTIEATVTLPSPCFAPIVFVTHPDGPWFAVTGL
jgi:hypothetical protein